MSWDAWAHGHPPIELEVMYAILGSGTQGSTMTVAPTIDKPAAISEADAGQLWRNPRS